MDTIPTLIRHTVTYSSQRFQCEEKLSLSGTLPRQSFDIGRLISISRNWPSVFQANVMDNSVNISNHYDPSLSVFPGDSSMLEFYPGNEEVEEHQVHEPKNMEALKTHVNLMNVSKKREKKTVSFPFGEWWVIFELVSISFLSTYSLYLWWPTVNLVDFLSSRICYDSATGVHYGVVTCEGCKVCVGSMPFVDSARLNFFRLGFLQTKYHSGCSVSMLFRWSMHYQYGNAEPM